MYSLVMSSILNMNYQLLCAQSMVTDFFFINFRRLAKMLKVNEFWQNYVSDINWMAEVLLISDFLNVQPDPKI